MVVTCGVCIVLQPLWLTEHVLLCSASITDTLDTSVGSSMPPRCYVTHRVEVAAATGLLVATDFRNLSGVASAHDVPVVIALLQRHLQGIHDFDLYCPRVAPSVGVVSCTYHHWFTPYSKRRRCCQLPVSGRRMQRFLQFRLASHSLPIVTGRLSGGQHVDRTDRVCSHCGGHAVADELHMVHECSALQPLRQQYAALVTADTDTMRSFFAKQDHMQVFSFLLDCLDFLNR